MNERILDTQNLSSTPKGYECLRCFVHLKLGGI